MIFKIKACIFSKVVDEMCNYFLAHLVPNMTHQSGDKQKYNYNYVLIHKSNDANRSVSKPYLAGNECSLLIRRVPRSVIERLFS